MHPFVVKVHRRSRLNSIFRVKLTNNLWVCVSLPRERRVMERPWLLCFEMKWRAKERRSVLDSILVSFMRDDNRWKTNQITREQCLSCWLLLRFHFLAVRRGIDTLLDLIISTVIVFELERVGEKKKRRRHRGYRPGDQHLTFATHHRHMPFSPSVSVSHSLVCAWARFRVQSNWLPQRRACACVPTWEGEQIENREKKD